jgi:hypothetical protein
MGLYLDTSALAKWYLNEPFSEQFEAFIREEPTAKMLVRDSCRCTRLVTST